MANLKRGRRVSIHRLHREGNVKRGFVTETEMTWSSTFYCERAI